MRNGLSYPDAPWEEYLNGNADRSGKEEKRNVHQETNCVQFVSGEAGRSRHQLWSSELNWEGKLVWQRYAEASMMVPTQASAVSLWTLGSLPQRPQDPGQTCSPCPTSQDYGFLTGNVFLVQLHERLYASVSPGVRLPAWVKMHLLKSDISKVTTSLIITYIKLIRINYLS